MSRGGVSSGVYIPRFKVTGQFIGLESVGVTTHIS